MRDLGGVAAPGDLKGGRDVANPVSFEVFDANVVPVPASVAMSLTGLAAVGVATRRRPAISARRAAA